MPSRYNNAVRRVDGTLWFVTGRGLTSLDPSRLAVSRPAPAARIETVHEWKLLRANLAVGITGGHDECANRLHRLDVRFSPRKVRFRYLLEGFDENWTDAGTRRGSRLHKCHNNYRFRIFLPSSEGVWNEEEAASRSCDSTEILSDAPSTRSVCSACWRRRCSAGERGCGR